MNIYEYLKKDHRTVDDMIEQMASTSDINERLKLFREIDDELSVHADTEEKTFYAEIEKKGGKQLQEKEEHAEEEHDEIRKYLKRLNKLDPKSDAWLITFGEFKYAVSHHVDEEENEIFEKARKVISDKRAQELAEEMDALKQKRKAPKKAA